MKDEQKILNLARSYVIFFGNAMDKDSIRTAESVRDWMFGLGQLVDVLDVSETTRRKIENMYVAVDRQMISYWVSRWDGSDADSLHRQT